MPLPTLNKKRKIDDEGRKFQERWELNYFCVEVNNKITCLICKETISVAKEYNIKRHYSTNHEKQFSCFEAKIREEKLKTMKNSLSSQQGVLTKFIKSNESVTRASYEISYLLAKHSKAFTDGSLIKECIIKAAEFVCPEKVQAFRDISLSRNTVADRITEMADDITSQLQKISTKIQFFSIAIDESTDIRDVAQVAVFFRGCDNNMRITEELLEFIPLHGTTTGEDIFDAVWSILEKLNLPVDKLVSVTTDGAKSMTGETKGFASRLARKLQDEYPDKPKIKAFHCLIHQQVLCLKLLKMDQVLKTVTKIVNFIRSRALNHRQFTSFLKDLESEFEDLPYYTEVRWLSCHNVLKSFYLILEEIILFFEMKDENNENISIIKDPLWVQDLAFLIDITGHLNNLNITLQGKDQLITNMYDAVASFVQKLNLFKNHLQKNVLTYFPTCEQLKAQNQSCSFSHHSAKIEKIKDEFDKRFDDFKEFEEIFSLFTGPFAFEVEKAPTSIQLELIDFQNDSILKTKYREVGTPKIYSYLGERYPEIKKFAAQILSFFGSTYLCEKLFSCMKLNKTAYRSRLTDKHLSAIMKIACSQSLNPDIEKLVRGKRWQVSSKNNKL